MMPVWAVDIPDYQDRLKWIYDLMPEVREFRGRSATSLSGGQQKLAALARALMMGGRLILLDEPSEGIAPVLARRISEILRDLKSEGMSILIAESTITTAPTCWTAATASNAGPRILRDPFPQLVQAKGDRNAGTRNKGNQSWRRRADHPEPPQGAERPDP